MISEELATRKMNGHESSMKKNKTEADTATYVNTIKKKDKYADTMEKIQTYEDNMSSGGRGLPAETAQDACVAAQNLLNRLDKGIQQDNADGRIDMGNTQPGTGVAKIHMKWEEEMLRIVNSSGRDESWKRRQRDIIRNAGDGAAKLNNAVRRYIMNKKEKDRTGSEDCWPLNNAVDQYERELERLRSYCPSIQVPPYMASVMKRCKPKPKPRPQGPPCDNVAAWARGLVAKGQTVGKGALGNPQNARVYPANLHLCYECQHSDGTPGSVILGGHGGWSDFYPAVVNVQRNCNCDTANMNISY
ncbi:MAG: hypothetical protein RDU41_10395 [Clostridia bacterium]|nr:hypothetical protein [Clostridia bacterium]